MTTVYHDRPAPAAIPEGFSRIVCISDTHNLIPDQVPDGDILVHTGDLTENGTYEELTAQIDFLISLPHAHKIFIGGNHDKGLAQDQLGLSKPSPRYMAIREQIQNAPNISYLENSGTEVLVRGRKWRIWGSPYTTYATPAADAFTYIENAKPNVKNLHPSESPFKTNTPRMIGTCDILLTHSPSLQIRDNMKYWDRSHEPPILRSSHLGSPSLLRLVRILKPYLHVHGHAHDGYGAQEIVHNVNAVSEVSEPEEWYWVGGQYLWERFFRRESYKTWVVNAALKPGSTDRDQSLRKPIVVDLQN